MTRPVLLVAAILAFAGSYASAQTPGRVSGRVVDQTGAPLPAVSIEPTHPVLPCTIRLGLQISA